MRRHQIKDKGKASIVEMMDQTEIVLAASSGNGHPRKRIVWIPAESAKTYDRRPYKVVVGMGTVLQTYSLDIAIGEYNKH